MEEKWYLCCHKSGQDNLFKAQASLQRLGVCTLSLSLQTKRKRSDGPGFRSVIEPLFPGYLFILLNLEEVHTSKIEYCPGVSHLVRFGGNIVPIRSAVVEEIMAIPACSQDPSIKKSRVVPLKTDQRKQIQSIIENHDPSSRGIMLLAFLEAVK